MVRELAFEARANATDRLKTPEEIAKEEKEKLEVRYLREEPHVVYFFYSLKSVRRNPAQFDEQANSPTSRPAQPGNSSHLL